MREDGTSQLIKLPISIINSWVNPLKLKEISLHVIHVSATTFYAIIDFFEEGV